jgi:hypothetical protein
MQISIIPTSRKNLTGAFAKAHGIDNSFVSDDVLELPQFGRNLLH